MIVFRTVKYSELSTPPSMTIVTSITESLCDPVAASVYQVAPPSGVSLSGFLLCAMDRAQLTVRVGTDHEEPPSETRTEVLLWSRFSSVLLSSATSRRPTDHLPPGVTLPLTTVHQCSEVGELRNQRQWARARGSCGGQWTWKSERAHASRKPRSLLIAAVNGVSQLLEVKFQTTILSRLSQSTLKKGCDENIDPPSMYRSNCIYQIYNFQKPQGLNIERHLVVLDFFWTQAFCFCCCCCFFLVRTSPPTTEDTEAVWSSRWDLSRDLWRGFNKK